MTEEEKKAIDILKDFTENELPIYCYDWDGFNHETILSAINRLLNLIEKQQKEIEYYKTQNENKGKLLNTSLNETRKHCISKDEVLKALGYEENDEEYDRLKQDDEKLLAILDTMYSEVCRLEDIEDKKVEVAVAFIEEKRDKYWQNKIKDKMLELEKEKEKYKGDKGLRYSQVGFIQSGINVLNKLLEE